MIISLTHKFIFVANLKAASTGMEHHLKKFGEIAITKTAHGKHSNLSQIAQDFAWINRRVPFSEFFVFGVLRDPIDYLLSLYNSHQKDAFNGTKMSTRGISFEQYYRSPEFHAWQRRPQSERLIDGRGRLAMSHLIRFSDMNTEYPAICKLLELPVAPLGSKNPSPKVATRADVSAEVAKDIAEVYASDYALWHQGPRDERVAKMVETLARDNSVAS